MRLIDGDALMRTHESEVAAIGNDWTVEDLAVAIEAAPTIKAIPIAWLRQKALESEDPFNPFMIVLYAMFCENKKEEHHD